MKMRKEKDTLGEIDVPSERLYGAQTARSLLHFPFTAYPMPWELIEALLLIKEVAAVANHRLGRLDAKRSKAIQEACQKARLEEYRQEFPLAVWQTGSGTQSNMNVNEVIARLGSLDLEKENISLHPNDHVNVSQSSNDTFPTALHVASVGLLEKKVLPALKTLQEALEEKEQAFSSIIKMGRTHLMDAVPLTLGQEFSAFVEQLKQDRERIVSALPHLLELALGGTAVGTGLNAPKEFGALCAKLLAEKTGLSFVTAPNKFAALASKEPLVFAHGALKTLATSLFKIANDIRWLGSGPRAGLSELILPANEPGSSIMPGKVNPTQCESMMMVAVQVMGNDQAITIGASQGNFQLNVMLPLLGYNMVQSCELLALSMETFTQHLVVGLKADEASLKEHVERSLMRVTALAPKLGYDKAASVAKFAHEKGLTLKEACLSLEVLDEQEIDELLRPEKMIG